MHQPYLNRAQVEANLDDLISTGRYSEAHSFGLEFLRRHPTDDILLNLLSVAAKRQGDPRNAINYLQLALAHVSSELDRAWLQSNLASTRCRSIKFDPESIRDVRAALRVHRRHERWGNVAGNLSFLASYERDRKNHRRARDLLVMALRLRRNHKQWREAASVIVALSEIDQSRDASESALRALEIAQRLSKRHGSAEQRCLYALKIGSLCHRLGRLQQAKDWTLESMSMAFRGRFAQHLSDGYHNLGVIIESMGNAHGGASTMLQQLDDHRAVFLHPVSNHRAETVEAFMSTLDFLQ